MNSISRYVFPMLVTIVFSVTIASCGLLKGGSAEYEKSTVDEPLQTPKDLQDPNRDAALIVPEEES